MENEIEFDKSPEKFIKTKVKKFVAEDADNRLFHLDNSPIFEEPVLGFAEGKNPLFKKYKEIIGEFHLTPAEILNKKEVSVICWILPISEKTKESNRKQAQVPSMRWAHTRNCGEKFNNKLRKFVVSLLKEKGYRAEAPMLSDLFEWKNDPDTGIASTWSERHALFAAGLGTFGLCDGFISRAGKAMRCGSVVTNLKLNPTVRESKRHDSDCLYINKEICGICRERCPANAITEKGHDKAACLEYQRKYIDPEKYGVETPGCGLCQTDVPCESKIPDANIYEKEFRL